MTSKLVGLFQQDLDEVFAYHTNIRIVLTDKVIGGCFRFLQFVVIFYFVVIAFFLENGYYSTETSEGLTILHGSASGTSRLGGGDDGIWDSVDVTGTLMEGDTAFIALSSTQSFGQKIDKCADQRACDADDDCITYTGETCKDGFCYGTNWCTSDKNVVRAQYDVIDHYFIWVRSQAKFYQIMSNEFTSMDEDKTILYPKENANTFSVSQILDMGKIPYREVKDEGAIIKTKVNIFWDCYITSQSCTPSFEVKRIDSFNDDDALGSRQTKYSYYLEGGTTRRNTFEMVGLKLIFETKARAHAFSFDMFVLEIATLFAFLRALYLIFDFVIYNFLPGYESFKREKYIVYDDHKNEKDDEEEKKAEEVGHQEAQEEGEHESVEERQNLMEEDDEFAGIGDGSQDGSLDDKH